MRNTRTSKLPGLLGGGASGTGLWSSNQAMQCPRSARKATKMSGVPSTEATGKTAPYSIGQRALAALYGLVCHATFGVAITAMMVGLYFGMTTTFGRLHGAAAPLVNALLLLQFPILHSLLLTKSGRSILSRLAPGRLGPSLSTTTFAVISSLQILSVFTLWTTSATVWWHPRGGALFAWMVAFGASWLFLLKSMWDSGLGVQTGFHGWAAVARGAEPSKIPFRPTGVFRYVRQPIYIAFALTLWTGPVWSPDHLAIALAWTTYCLVGPLLKEKRYLNFYGEAFREYRESVPYWIPVATITDRNRSFQ